MFVSSVADKARLPATIRAQAKLGDGHFAVGTETGLLAEYVIDTETGIATLVRESQLQAGIMCMKKYGDDIAVGLNNGHIMLQRQDGTLLLMSSKCTQQISCLETCGDYLFAGSWDSAVYVYKGTSFVSATSGLCGQSVLALCNVNDRYMVAGGSDGSMCICDVATIEDSAKSNWYLVYHAHSQPVRSIVNLTPDEASVEREEILGSFLGYIASTGNDGILHVHAIKAEPVVHVVPDPVLTYNDPYSLGQFAYALAYDEKTSTLAMCGADITFDVFKVSWEGEPERESGVAPSIKLLRKVPSVSLIWNALTFSSAPDKFLIVTTGESKSIDVFSCSYFKPADTECMQQIIAADIAYNLAADLAGNSAFDYGKYNIIPASRFTNSHKSVIPTHDLLTIKEIMDTYPYPEGMLLLAVNPVNKDNANVFLSCGGQWIQIGYVTPGDGNGAATKVLGNDGKYYDFQFPIEVENRSYSMFANRGENPYLVADRVLEQNPSLIPGMDVDSYKKQIADFLMENMPKDKVNKVFKVLSKRGIKKTSDELFLRACKKCIEILQTRGIASELLEFLSVGVEGHNEDETYYSMFPSVFDFLGRLLLGNSGDESSGTAVELDPVPMLTDGNEIFPFLAVITYMLDKNASKLGNIDNVSLFFRDKTLDLLLDHLIEISDNMGESQIPVYYLNVSRLICVILIYIIKCMVNQDTAKWLEWNSDSKYITGILLKLQAWLLRVFTLNCNGKIPDAIRASTINDLVGFFDFSRRNGKAYPGLLFCF